jgi:tRNA pseudouridine55 synthase
VRSLVHELGQQLGCGAHLASLRRTASGKFDVGNALPLDQLLQLDIPRLEQRVIPMLQLNNPS